MKKKKKKKKETTKKKTKTTKKTKSQKSLRDMAYTMSGKIDLPGRNPKSLTPLEARLDQVIRECQAWFRLAGNVWFNHNEPIIMYAHEAENKENLPGLYDKAIHAIRLVRGFAELGEEHLIAGKDATMNHLDQIKKKKSEAK